MLKGRQTNHSVRANYWSFAPATFHYHHNNLHQIITKCLPQTLDLYYPFGNVYYAACDGACPKRLQAAEMPRESAERSGAQRLARSEGWHAATRKDALKMHKLSGLSIVWRLVILVGYGRRDEASISFSGVSVLSLDYCECMWESHMHLQWSVRLMWLDYDS